MNDPHVEALYYRFVSENPGHNFSQAAPLKAKGAGPATLTEAQKRWLESVVPRLIYRVGEITAGAAVDHLTMAYFPKL
jgi:hypothetical protein